MTDAASPREAGAQPGGGRAPRLLPANLTLPVFRMKTGVAQDGC